MSFNSSVFSKKAIEEAHERIEPYIHRTPILSSAAINEIAGCQIVFKCENFQKIGAFKMRGGANAILQLTDAQKQNGVVTHSSGNHAQAVAMGAKLKGIPAYIVMPSNAPKVKVKAVEGYGGEITFCEPNQKARVNLAAKIELETGATFVHPYNNEKIVLGQATVAKEFFEDHDDLDILITPIGGGGLLSGSVLSRNFYSPNCKIYGSEPEGANAAELSVKQSKLTIHPNPTSIADGLLASLGEITFSIIHNQIEDVLTVSETEIKSAMKLIWERMKIIVEPSSAVPLAAMLKNKVFFKDKKVGVILTGGNVDLGKLPF